MLLIIHVVIALSGIFVAAVALMKLSEKLITISYGLTAFTLLSGVGLVTLSDGNMLKSCLSGLLYLATILTLTLLAKYKLVAERSNQ